MRWQSDELFGFVSRIEVVRSLGVFFFFGLFGSHGFFPVPATERGYILRSTHMHIPIHAYVAYKRK